MTMIPELVFLDLETTGLEPTRDSILEIGIVVVDGLSLSKLSAWSALVQPPWHALRRTDARHAAERRRLGEYVYRMHEKSGLLAALSASDASVLPLCDAEQQACEFLTRWGIEYGKATIAGFCPQFDMGFLKAHMPTLAGWFDYRHVDVSTIRGVVRRWVGPEIDAHMKARAGETDHRAVADCFEAINELAFYKQFMDLDGLRKQIGGAQ